MVLSHSIKTVSKPDKLRKKKKAAAASDPISTSAPRGNVDSIASTALFANPVAVLAAAAMSTVGTVRSASDVLSPSAPKRKRAAIGNPHSIENRTDAFFPDSLRA